MRGARLPNEGDELLDKLRSLTRRIEMLERRPDGRITGQEFPAYWTPQLRAVTSNPGGTRDLRQGNYFLQPIMNVTDWVLCTGWGLVRIDSASATRGSGYYLLDLPFPVPRPKIGGVRADPWYKIGTVDIGFADITHRSGLGLHRNGIAPGDPGASTGTQKAAIITTSADTDWSFVDNANPKPGVDVVNVHFDFSYAIPRPS